MPGIVDALSVTSLHGGGSVNFAVGSLAARVGLLVTDFNARARLEGSGNLPKLQTQGNWPGFSDPRELVIDVEGRCVGESPTDYWSKRAALLAALVPPFDYTRTVREHFTVYATYPGQSQVYADAMLADYDFPVTSAGGRFSDYRFAFVAPFGYWRTVSGDTPVVL